MKHCLWVAAAVAGGLLAHAAPTSKIALLRRHEEELFREGRSNASALGGPWDGWTTSSPDSTDYNQETHVWWLPFSVEGLFARLYCLLLASSPLLLAALAEEQLTRAHLLESCALLTWLGGTLYLFCNVLKFQSAHFEGVRPLTLVEAVYLMSQILTTVGYGDITPAFPRGQVWVGINVVFALCLYGSMIMEVVGIVQVRFAKAMQRANYQPGDHANEPLKNWLPKVDNTAFLQTVAFFVAVALLGVVFWHSFPGEGKTWFQAVYMSVITLSTVGFGAFTATTEGGKVFGAFWMLFGVAALGALVGGFVNWMRAQKELQSFYLTDHGGDFAKLLKECSSDGETLTKTEFLKFALMLTKGADPQEFQRIQRRFEFLRDKDGEQEDWVRQTTIVAAEGPPL